MELKFDEYKMHKANVSFPELLVLKLLDDSVTNNYYLPSVVSSLINSGYVSSLSDDNLSVMTITNTGQMVLNRIVNEKSKDQFASEDDERLEKIAEAMKECYPKGFKRDDFGEEAYPWRGSTAMIKDRLHKFEERFYDGKKLDLEDAVETTRRYVESCKRRYRRGKP